MTGQDAFRAALLDAGQPAPDGLTDGLGRPAGRRYNVYRNNVAVSLRAALATGFPAVRSLIGAGNFDMVADGFLRAHPPDNPVMMHYGTEFPTYLAAQAPLQKWGYLPDVARLELALRRSYHAADTPALDPAALAELDEAALTNARLRLSPAVVLVTSAWPVVSVWRFAMRGGDKPPAQAQTALILRPEYDPEPHILPQGGAAFVASLARGNSFDAALTSAGDSFDLAFMLNLLLSQGAITEIY